MSATVSRAELKALAEAATPGPWTTKTPEKNADGWVMGILVAATAPGSKVYADPPGGSFPALLSQVETLREALRRVQDDLPPCGFDCGCTYCAASAALASTEDKA